MPNADTVPIDAKDKSSRLSPGRKSRCRLATSFAVAGAISFWLPDVLVHLHSGPTLDSRHGWAITILAPGSFLMAYVATRRFALKRDFTWLGVAMLLGVWLSGGLFMTLAAMVSGSGFIGGTGVWRLVAIVLSVIPIVTYILAAYDGSLFALLAVTVGALILWGLRTSWILWREGSTMRSVSAAKPAIRNVTRAA
ncbi:MAG TPA: hypothetical protein VFD30_22010 [Terriglobia bacterium]|nr:hypothetical protein [Terriglobia bacterium]